MTRPSLRSAAVVGGVALLTLAGLGIALPVTLAVVGLLVGGTSWLAALGTAAAGLCVGGGGAVAAYLLGGRRIDGVIAGAAAAGLAAAPLGLVLGATGAMVALGFATVPVEEPMRVLTSYAAGGGVLAAVVGGGLGGVGGLLGHRARRRTDGETSR